MVHFPPSSLRWCRVKLASHKRQLLSQQHDERAQILTDLEKLDADYSRDIENIRRQTRANVFRHEISREQRRTEDKDLWEYLNDMVEFVYMYTWRKSETGIFQRRYLRRRLVILEDLRDLDTHHRKERIKTRFKSRPVDEEPLKSTKVNAPRFFMS